MTRILLDQGLAPGAATLLRHLSNRTQTALNRFLIAKQMMKAGPGIHVLHA